MEEREALVALRQEFRERVQTLEEQLGLLAERLEQFRGLTAEAGDSLPAPGEERR
jgi:septation ring formation regulator EzrA